MVPVTEAEERPREPATPQRRSHGGDKQEGPDATLPQRDMQLTFDGDEVPHPADVPRAAGDLTPTQREVLLHVREHGSISPKQAGLFLYATQRTPWRAPYASADGSEVLRRLALRGLVHRERPGVWVAGPGEPPPIRRSEKRRKGGYDGGC